MPYTQDRPAEDVDDQHALFEVEVLVLMQGGHVGAHVGEPQHELVVLEATVPREVGAVDREDRPQPGAPEETRNKSQRNQLQRPKRGTNQHDVVDTIDQNR